MVGYTDGHTPLTRLRARQKIVHHTLSTSPVLRPCLLSCRQLLQIFPHLSYQTDNGGEVFFLSPYGVATLAEGYNIGLIIRQYIKPAAHIISQTSDRKIGKISQVLSPALPYNLYIESYHSKNFSYLIQILADISI